MSRPSPIVIATFSRRMQLRLPDDARVYARIKGRRLRPVCGDRVDAEPIAGEEDWLITAIHDRDNELTRPDVRGRTEILAANIDLLIVVAAVEPTPDWFVVDRYLSAAEVMHAAAAVVLNKTDLAVDEIKNAEPFAEYAMLGYPTLEASAIDGSGIEDLARLIGTQTAIFVGQSGVGKSSLINAMLDIDAQRTAEISAKRDEGRHTTVNSVMLDLPDGGFVIDSPGVRDYAPALQGPDAVGQGFREIEAARADCRFANCRHTREPGCAVKAAVENGTISERRYESYKRLVNLTQRLESR